MIFVGDFPGTAERLPGVVPVGTALGIPEGLKPGGFRGQILESISSHFSREKFSRNAFKPSGKATLRMVEWRGQEKGRTDSSRRPGWCTVKSGVKNTRLKRAKSTRVDTVKTAVGLEIWQRPDLGMSFGKSWTVKGRPGRAHRFEILDFIVQKIATDLPYVRAAVERFDLTKKQLDNLVQTNKKYITASVRERKAIADAYRKHKQRTSNT